MFDLEDFYNKCSSGDKVDCNGILDYIKSFNDIILWGASFQGAAIGKYLTENGINISLYWDMRHEELKKVNGIEVLAPHSNVCDREHTIIIFCIPNHVIMPELLRELNTKGYKHIVRGDILYSGCICTFNNSTPLNANKCWGTKECRSVICNKASTIIKNQNSLKKPGERIDLTYCAFIINSICNLSCKHCVQYVNSYPVNTRRNVPYERIIKDVDTFLPTIDSVGTIAVMGGETFMHPDIGRIVKRFSCHKNFGFLSLPTNGLFPIRPEQLEDIDDPRIIISFGYYLHVASEKQKEIYYNNVDVVKKFGISYTESVQLPTWVIPSEIAKLDVDEEYMSVKKQGCPMPPRNLQVTSGKVHVCDRSVALHSMGKVDYQSDYLDLDKEQDMNQRRESLRELINRDFYYTCAHCYATNSTVLSAIQGTRDVFITNNSMIYRED